MSVRLSVCAEKTNLLCDFRRKTLVRMERWMIMMMKMMMKVRVFAAVCLLEAVVNV